MKVVYPGPARAQLALFHAAGYTSANDTHEKYVPSVPNCSETLRLYTPDQAFDAVPIRGRIARAFVVDSIKYAVNWETWDPDLTILFIAAASVAMTVDSSLSTVEQDHQFRLRHFGPLYTKDMVEDFDDHVMDCQDDGTGYNKSEDYDIWFCPKTGIISTYDKQFLKILPAVLHLTIRDCYC